MKILLKSILNAIAFLPIALTAYSASAQNNAPQSSPGCFMLDANGNPVDLGNLCGGSNSSNASTIKTRNSQQNNRNSFVVPIKRKINGTPVVDVQFNDKYVFEMLFDTGATMTLITRPMADTLKLESTGSLPFKTASSSLIFMETAMVYAINAGNLRDNHFKIAIGDSLEIGLLGQDFYGMYDITIKSDSIEFKKR
jgi:hypothetical protein